MKAHRQTSTRPRIRAGDRQTAARIGETTVDLGPVESRSIRAQFACDRAGRTPVYIQTDCRQLQTAEHACSSCISTVSKRRLEKTARQLESQQVQKYTQIFLDILFSLVLCFVSSPAPRLAVPLSLSFPFSAGRFSFASSFLFSRLVSSRCSASVHSTSSVRPLPQPYCLLPASSLHISL